MFELHTIAYRHDFELPEEQQAQIKKRDFDSLLAYLGQWDFGHESLHSPVYTENVRFGTNTKEYIVSIDEGFQYQVSISDLDTVCLSIYRAVCSNAIDDDCISINHARDDYSCEPTGNGDYPELCSDCAESTHENWLIEQRVDYGGVVINGLGER
jgi:hypothetical protein|tara:strand:- start:165 stop:629 length:465 start_codon:yes stop_codon:yes gene_type:complete